MERHDPGAANKFGRSRPMVECAQCGRPLYVPEWSEYIDGDRVRHFWQCDTCDYRFRYAAA
jgi:hypothetical protein